MTDSPLGIAPRALILDYGGVIVSSAKRAEGFGDLGAVVDTTLRRANIEIPLDRLEQSLRAGTAALKDYNNMSSRRRAPRELSHRELWVDFMASDLPEEARLVLGADAVRLSEAKVSLLSEHTVRPGVRELLELCRERGIRTGISSNAQSGRAHRVLLDAHDLSGLIDVQLYSDGIGIRKPHPGMLEILAEALHVAPADCWYVGDTRDRDLLAGRRAGVGAVVLIRHHNTDSPRYPVQGEPEAVFDEVTELLDAVRAAADPAGPGARAVVVREPAPRRTAAGPTALLLDNGGVLSLSEKLPEAIEAWTGELAGYLRGAGHEPPTDLHGMLLAGIARYKRWKHDADGGERVPEVTPEQYWGDLIAVDWAPGLRAAVIAEAPELTYRLASVRARRRLRPGMTDVLAYARERGIPVGIVSNTICGRVPRGNQVAWGLEPYVGVSFYSDEFGFRKPDPSIVRACADALRADPAGAWFVGDKRGRDVEASRRAGIGTAVLIESRQTSESTGPEPDLSVSDAAELLAALRRSVEDPAAGIGAAGTR